eukprot:UN14769
MLALFQIRYVTEEVPNLTLVSRLPWELLRRIVSRLLILKHLPFAYHFDYKSTIYVYNMRIFSFLK